MINQLYYFLKPFLTRNTRLKLRRIRAKRVIKKCAKYWPIFEASGCPPENWPGWPENKDFAFVLTHDVEGQVGLDRCRQLAKIEMEYGFRSSFNFIPESTYQVPESLLDWLCENGFEVGVHDLHHDGKLYRSYKKFKQNVACINRYIANWKAEGFRAGFMLHRLNWLHLMNIKYDASTFDIDPFEAEPDGTQTVFPFWVKRPDPEADAFKKAVDKVGVTETDTSSAKGYIELPYTLVQDYNLFVVLGNKTIDIWQKKLSWLVEKRAMALLDTHPDYMAMDGVTPTKHEFAVERYREFLDHVRTAYAGRYWHALPRELASWCRTFRPKQARPPRQVIMVVYSNYTTDGRVRRYAETLVRRGDHVRVFCLGPEAKVRSCKWETLNGVKFLPLQSRATRESRKSDYAWRLGVFFIRALMQLSPKKL